MGCCCDSYTGTAEQQFTADRANKELERYRRKGPGQTTRMLRDGLGAAGLIDGSLMDIGAGIGALTAELLERGMSHSLIVEASSGYLTAARTELDRRGMEQRVRFVHADFLTAGALPPAAVVTLDRVICCYPFYEPFLEQALACAERGFAYSYPRDRWFVRAALAVENAMRPRSCSFRAFVHPPGRMRQIIERGGFQLVNCRSSMMWSADVFARRA